jgi:hypothetical protein
MNRTQFTKQLQEGLNTIFGMEYDDLSEEWTDIFTQSTSKKAYEEDVLLVGLGGASEKTEGGTVSFDAGSEGWVARYQHLTFALAFSITEEAVEDGLYGDLSAKYAKSMARGMKYTKEVRHAGVINNGHSSSYAGGDGKALFATDHPLWNGGTISNKLATAADLSEESLEDACIQIEGWTDDRGVPVKIMPKKLIVHRANKFTANKILNTATTPFTANLTVNALKSMRAIPEGYAINHFMIDPDQWTIVTDCPDGFKHFKRRGIKKGMETDFKTSNMMYKVSERYSFGWTNPRAGFSSEGN